MYAYIVIYISMKLTRHAYLHFHRIAAFGCTSSLGKPAPSLLAPTFARCHTVHHPVSPACQIQAETAPFNYKNVHVYTRMFIMYNAPKI